jgi:hypothetical protein
VEIGGIPVFVDEDCRDDLIPKGTQNVHKVLKGLHMLDKFESIPNSSSNFFVEEAKYARLKMEQERKDKPTSLLTK